MSACRGRTRGLPSASTKAPCTAASTVKSTSPTCSSALIGMFVLMLAWFGGEQLVVRPIRSLVRTAARFGRGDLHVRASQEPWVAEFEPLAAALRRHGGQARRARGGIAASPISISKSWQASTGSHGLANRRGFDRQLERDWQRAVERQRADRADDDRYRSFQAVQRPLRPRRRRHLLARGRRDAVAGHARDCRAGRPLWRRGIRAAVARPRYRTGRRARRRGAPSRSKTF